MSKLYLQTKMFLLVAISIFAIQAQGQNPDVTTVEVDVQNTLPAVDQESYVEQRNLQSQGAIIVEGASVLSRSDDLKNRRKQEEQKTENQILEKLESERLQAEQQRQKNFFNIQGTTPQTPYPYYDNPYENPQNQAAARAPQQPNYRAPSQTLSQEAGDILGVGSIFGAGHNEEYYTSVILGTIEYPQAVNIKSNITGGFSVGASLSDRYLMELGFLYSNYYVNDHSAFKELDQFAVQGAVKYRFLTGRIRPVLGVVGAYTYRRYSDISLSFRRNYPSYNDDYESSNSLDFGFVTGVDVLLNNEISLSLDYRYMLNLANRSSTDSVYDIFYGREGIEDLDYYLLGVGLRMHF